MADKVPKRERRGPRFLSELTRLQEMLPAPVHCCSKEEMIGEGGI